MQILDEIKEKFGISELQEIAQLLGKDPSTISKWLSSGEIPAKAERELKLLLIGKNRDIIGHQTQTIGDQRPQYDDEITAAVAKIMRELSPKGRYEVMHYASALRIKENNCQEEPA
jgi:hypothetical protein